MRGEEKVVLASCVMQVVLVPRVDRKVRREELPLAIS